MFGSTPIVFSGEWGAVREAALPKVFQVGIPCGTVSYLKMPSSFWNWCCSFHNHYLHPLLSLLASTTACIILSLHCYSFTVSLIFNRLQNTVSSATAEQIFQTLTTTVLSCSTGMSECCQTALHQSWKGILVNKNDSQLFLSFARFICIDVRIKIIVQQLHSSQLSLNSYFLIRAEMIFSIKFMLVDI